MFSLHFLIKTSSTSRGPSDLETNTADNYDHLHEAPTRFYTICVALALAHSSSTSTLDLETNLAWAYVGLRIAHSIVQATTNVIMVRFSLFILSETVMLGLLYKAVQAIF